MRHIHQSILLLICLTVLFASFVGAQEKQSKNLFLVSVKGKQGFIDKTGIIVIKPIYEQVQEFVNGYAPVKINSKWGIIDETGKIIVNPQFDEIRWSFHEELTSFRLGEKWGYINKSGEIVIKPTLKYGHSFDDGRAVINVGKNSELRHGIIDKSGKLVIRQLFEWSGWSFSEGLLSVKIDGKWGFIDVDGKIVIPAKYKDAHDFSEGLAAVEFGENKNQWGFIDKTGKIVVQPQFEDSWYFNDGLAAIEKDQKYGFIDKQGKIIIEPKFDWTYSFSENLAAVRVDGKWGFIDKTGKFVIEPKYDEVWSFDNGLCGVGVGEWKTDKSKDPHRFSMPYLDGKWGYIDKTGKYIWQPTK